MKKRHIYGIIMIVWIAVCIALFASNLIDWIGILVSFVFAIPPIFVDLITTKVDEQRKQKLEQIGVIHKFLKYIDDMIADSVNCNFSRQRTGAVVQMGLIDIKKIVHETFDDNKTKAYYEKCLSIVFGAKKCEKFYIMMENDRVKFTNELEKIILKLNPSENECSYYKLILSEKVKKLLFQKKNGEMV